MDKAIFDEIEKMSEEEKVALLNTQFPEELEKEAAAELDATLLADSLYNYGWLQAQRSLAEVDGLDKVAAADLKAHEDAEKEVGEQIEASLSALGAINTEDLLGLHKEAQVAAAIIFDGFSDCIEKEAAGGAMATARSLATKGVAKLKGAAGKAGHKTMALGKRGLRKGLALARKHPGKALGGAAAAGALGGAAAHKAMSKESSALSWDEYFLVTEVSDGLDKLASKGEKKGKKFHEMYSKASKSSKSSKES